MARPVAALAAGLIFGFGLALSDMVNPAPVLAFLDILGAWDPAIGSVVLGEPRTLGFIAAVAAGMIIARLIPQPGALAGAAA